MNIDEMPAGPEFDALLAERVMGWAVRKPPRSFHQLPDVPLPDVYFNPLRREKCWRVNGKRLWQEWRPSEDIAAAWEALERAFGDSGHVKIRMMKWDYWQKVGWSGPYGCQIGEGRSFSCADTAPLAICRAVLAVMEEKT